MATIVLTSAQSAEGDVADRALELLGVKALSQSPDTDSWVRAGEAALRVFDRLDGLGLVPFANDEIPEWAQTQIIALTAAELIPLFAVPAERMALVTGLASGAVRSLSGQISKNRPKPPTVFKVY